jgi:hypothetical protein
MMTVALELSLSPGEALSEKSSKFHFDNDQSKEH